MLSELRKLLNTQIETLKSNCYDHVGIEMRVKITTLRWVIQEIDRMEQDNAR